jgi:LemA protein
MPHVGWVVLLLAVLVAAYVISTYNSLVVLRQRVRNAWAQVDVQLKRRHDLIPNLVSTVKGYSTHEREVFEKVTEARAKAVTAGSVAEKAGAENLLTGALRSVFAVAENYPELKADANFRQLQEELTNTEGKIAFSRQFYNDTVLKLNTRIERFPANLIAGTLGFSQADYFNLDGQNAAREPVNVQF